MVAPIAGSTFPNRILVTATAPGSSAIALGTTTSVLGYKTFSSLTNGQTVDYWMEGIDGNGALTGTWEVGTGTYNSIANTFSRTNVIENHTGGTTPFNFVTDVRIGVGPSVNLFSKFDAVTTQRIQFNYVGGVFAITGNSRWYPQREITLKSTYCSINTIANNNVEYIIKKNGVSLGTVFSLPATYNKSSPIALNTIFTTSDYITIDIITGGGSDLIIYIEYV